MPNLPHDHQASAIAVGNLLRVDGPQEGERAMKLLQKAETNCLVSNSLKTAILVEPEILVAS